MSEVRARDYIDRWMSEKSPEEQAAIRKGINEFLEGLPEEGDAL